jgi:hypothetical protein
LSNFKSTIEKIRALEAERKNILLEIDELRKMADSKAKALESEVGMLREEVKSLRLLLGADEEFGIDKQESLSSPKKKK